MSSKKFLSSFEESSQGKHDKKEKWHSAKFVERFALMYM